MRPSSRKTLEVLAGELGPARFRALIDDIRNAAPEDLPGAPKNNVSAKNADPLVTEVTALLAPILARSTEKAELLVDHLQKLTGKGFAIKPAGLADTVRALRKSLSDEDIRDGAYGLRVYMQQEYSLREIVK
jgi:hypothetical protein